MTTSKNIVTALCHLFIARSAAQQMKGKTRDKAALEFFCGAASLADAIGDKALYSPLAFLSLMIATRGAEEVDRRAKNEVEVNAIEHHEESTSTNIAPTFAVKTVVAIGPDCYGVGLTIEEATKNMKRENSKAVLRALRFYECERDQLTFECGVGLTILAPKGTRVARLEVGAVK